MKVIYKGKMLTFAGGIVNEDDYGRRHFTDVFEDEFGEVYFLNSVLDKYETEQELKDKKNELLLEIEKIDNKLKLFS